MADDPTPTPAPDPTPDPEPTPTPQAFAPITSQEEFDARIQDRIRRVKAQPPADYEELQAKAAKLDELEAANKTELERAQQEAADNKARLDQVLADAKETRLRAAIITEAAKPGRNVVDPEAVVALLDRSTLDVDDNGVPTNIAAAMDSLLEARPYLVAETGPRAGSADQGARTGGANQLGESALKDMTDEEIVQAQREGRFKSLGVGR